MPGTLTTGSDFEGDDVLFSNGAAESIRERNYNGVNGTTGTTSGNRANANTSNAETGIQRHTRSGANDMTGANGDNGHLGNEVNAVNSYASNGSVIGPGRETASTIVSAAPHGTTAVVSALTASTAVFPTLRTAPSMPPPISQPHRTPSVASGNYSQPSSLSVYIPAEVFSIFTQRSPNTSQISTRRIRHASVYNPSTASGRSQPPASTPSTRSRHGGIRGGVRPYHGLRTPSSTNSAGDETINGQNHVGDLKRRWENGGCIWYRNCDSGQEPKGYLMDVVLRTQTELISRIIKAVYETQMKAQELHQKFKIETYI
ncbi:hypothetical protein BZA77DRAFT_289910 [Pyronema omphalodes]|nr:hypothetical protein BZA77DRAFT_289910 [Pyronema omphalodes]